MFTGLVLGMGKVAAVRNVGAGRRLEVETPAEIGREVRIGDSVAVSGVCLTAVAVAPARLAFDAIPETISRTNLGRLHAGDAVNLELPLRAADRLGGHFVQGHVDAVGTVRHAGPRGGDWILEVAVEPAMTRWMVEKGSIAIDGVSLTLARVSRDSFSIGLIPHTREVTTLGRLRPGSAVNVEVDVLAKYVERLLPPRA